MKALKKLLSGILIAGVVMSTVSLSALASETVSAINVTFEKPVPGAAPATLASVTEEASVEVLSIKWSPSDQIFAEGKTYTVTINLGIKSGVDAVFADAKSMSVKMNGSKVRRVETAGKSATVKFGWILRNPDANKTTSQDTSVKSAQTSSPKTETSKPETIKTKSGFSDVKDNDYFSAAVCWAVDKNITLGTSATTFSPDDTCTRAQILTFLWRAVGSPKLETYVPFNDVNTTDYFFNASNWAKKNGMVSGTEFDPNIPCTRAYTVIYLWKNAGSPKTEVTNVFSDVSPDAEYAQAVAWAVKNGVTSGTSATSFSPNDTCTRGQIVTFLNRALVLAPNSSSDEKTDQNEKNNNAAEIPKSDDNAKDTTKQDEKTNPTDTKDTADTTNPTDKSKTDNSDSSKTDTTPKQDTETKTGDSGMNELVNSVQTKEKYDTAKYEAAVKKALREALGDDFGSGMTELQKALLLHDWLVLNCQYDITVARPYCHSEYGAIVEGYAVCSGYARAYSDLLSRVGIESEYVLGMKPLREGDLPQPHAWNRVTIDGVKYHVDVTSDDPVPDRPGKTSYTYFLVSDKGLKTHSGYTKHCTDTKYENNKLLRGYYAQFIWDSRINAFYYVDMAEVKTTTDFSESLKPSGTKEGAKPTSVLLTSDGKYICFFKPSYVTSEYPMYLYSLETGEYYNYTAKGIKDIIFDRLVQNGNNIEVTRDYYKNGIPYITKVDASIPLPASSKARSVTFDANYSDGKTTSIKFINEYWANGNGSFDELKRTGFTFDGWYTAKDGGTKVESFGDVKGDDVTLYAHWWSPWKITGQPTMTETGKAVRTLEGCPDVKEEITLPILSDTSVWKQTMNVSSTTTSHGKQKYSSEYGEVSVILPLKDPEPYKYGIVYKNGSVFITVEEAGIYTMQYEAKENGEVMSSAKINVRTDAPGEYPVNYPKKFTPSGTITATFYDSDMNELGSVEYKTN